MKIKHILNFMKGGGNKKKETRIFFLNDIYFFITHQLFLSLSPPQLFLPLSLHHLLLLLATIGGDYEICFFLRRGIIINIVSLLPPSSSIVKLPSTFLSPPLPLFIFSNAISFNNEICFFKIYYCY